MVYSKDDSDDVIRLKLGHVTNTLLQRYGAKPAASLSEIINNNKDIPVSYLNIWTKKVENQTAAQYLIAKGIIQKNVDTRSEEEKRNDKLIVNVIYNCLLHCSAPWSKIDGGGGYYEHSRIYTQSRRIAEGRY